MIKYHTLREENNILLCSSLKRCRGLSREKCDTCPCEGRSLDSVCPRPWPISWSQRRGSGPYRRTHPLTGSAASPALWFAEDTGTEWALENCRVKACHRCGAVVPWLWCGSPRAPSEAPVCGGCWSPWRCVWTDRTHRCRGSTPEPGQWERNTLKYWLSECHKTTLF